MSRVYHHLFSVVHNLPKELNGGGDYRESMRLSRLSVVVVAVIPHHTAPTINNTHYYGWLHHPFIAV